MSAAVVVVAPVRAGRSSEGVKAFRVALVQARPSAPLSLSKGRHPEPRNDMMGLDLHLYL